MQICTLWWFSNRAVSIRNTIQANDRLNLFELIEQRSETKGENLRKLCQSPNKSVTNVNILNIRSNNLM